MTQAAGAIERRSPPEAMAPPRVSAWIVALLTIAMFINYADRGSLSVAAPVLKDMLGVSDAQMGLLLSAFFWTYALAQPLAGSVVQRFDVHKVLALGLALWAGATLLTGLASGFAALLALRLLMGIGESVIYPANARILAEQAPEELRGRCNGLIAMGMCLGPSGGTLVGGLVMAHFGWRAVFICLGALSLLWLLPWLATPMRLPAPPRRAGGPQGDLGPGYGELLRCRALWGVSLGQFFYSWLFYLLLTWLPLYLVKFQHMSLTLMAGVGAGVYALQSLAAFASGWASDAMIRKGASPTLVRKGLVLTGVAGSGAAILLLSLDVRSLTIPCLAASGLFVGMGNPLQFAIGQTLAGPTAGGRWMGIQNMCGNFAGILAPAATGWIVQATGSFAAALQLAAAFSVAGVLCFGFLLGRIEPVEWRPRALAAAKRAAVQ